MKRILELNDCIDRKKFENIIVWRIKPDPIIKVRCTKPKNEMLKVHLIKKKVKYEYTEIVFVCELVKYGYNEWTQIQKLISKHKSIHAQEMKSAM